MHGQNPRSRNGNLSPRRVLGVAASLALGVAALTACEDGNAVPDTFEYVAIGDSFTATGLPVADNSCARSSQNYPQLVAEERPDLTLVDVSCGAASTENMLEAQEVGGTVQPPQFNSLSAQTDVVTVSLGGNDYDFISTFLFKCVNLAPTDPDGDPCRTSNRGRLERQVVKIRDNLATVLEEAGDRAPGARIIMVGYPHLLPDKGHCPRRVPVATGDVDYVRDMMASLVEAQRGAAADAGVEYVDVWSASEGHDVCSKDPWVNDNEDGPKGAYAFHPMPAHQGAVADLILEIL